MANEGQVGGKGPDIIILRGHDLAKHTCCPTTERSPFRYTHTPPGRMPVYIPSIEQVTCIKIVRQQLSSATPRKSYQQGEREAVRLGCVWRN